MTCTDTSFDSSNWSIFNFQTNTEMKNLYIALFLLFSGSAFAQTSITVDSVFQTSTCAGGNVIIPFTYTGTFPFGNVFTAQLSDFFGNFGSPVNMGSTMFVVGGNGVIFGTIPASTNFGFLYRIRVVSSNPADTSSASANTIIVTQVAQLNQVVSNPGDSACPGDTITLTALNFANSYSWSTGDTSQSITVTQSGIYSVTTTDALTCQSTASDTVLFDPSFCVGIHENELESALEVYPNPASGAVFISFVSSYGNDAYFDITDLTGKRIRSEKLRTDGAGRQMVNVSELNAGVYFFTLHVNGQVLSRKLIIE